MPRNEGFLDPAAGPVASFAWDLRALREKSGKVPYRVLAKRAGFCASTLSVAAAGVKLPSLDVTLAYVQACGGDPETWRERWHALAEELPPTQPAPAPTAQPALQVAPPYDADEHGEPALPDAVLIRLATDGGQPTPTATATTTARELPAAPDRTPPAGHETARPELAIRAAAPLAPIAHGRLRAARPWRSRLRTASISRMVTVALALLTVALGVRVLVPAGAGAAPAIALPPLSDGPVETPMQQADSLYLLIYQYTPWRAGATDAFWDVNSCRNLSNAQSKLRTIARSRQQQVETLATLDVTKVPDGSRLVVALKHAWLASAQSATAYANIAADLQAGCSTGAIATDPNYQQADAYAQAASAAKAEAAQLWNNNADGLGLPRITGNQL